MADIVEKPSVEEAPSTLAVAARYVFAPGIFQHLAETKPGKGGEIQLTDAIRALIHKGGKVVGMRLPVEERRYDIGNFESYFEAFSTVRMQPIPSIGPTLRKRIREVLKEIARADRTV